MNETSVLLKAYYEALYDRLQVRKELLFGRIEELLAEEVALRRYADFNREKYEAYRDACLAFLEERIELYDPFGIQYVFDRSRTREAFELELQLNWYDSREEFHALVEAARDKTEPDVTPERLRLLAEQLIADVGAFPDRSIITSYEAKPGLNKLPDYIVARVIEEDIV
jgi:hypothetical protein